MLQHDQWLDWIVKKTTEPIFTDPLSRADELNRNIELSPYRSLWFKALSFEDISKLKVIIVGDKPYYDSYAADGYAFSSIDEADLEMQLLYKKIYDNLHIVYNQSDNSKERWYKQGILCYPLEFTCVSGSHKKNEIIWRDFNIEVLKYIAKHTEYKVFIFLDRYAHQTAKRVFENNFNTNGHLIIDTPIHSVEFNKRAIFTLTQNFIKKNYKIALDWR